MTLSDKLKQTLLAELELDDFPLEATTTANTVPGWDSLRHVQIIAAVEKAFNVRFKTVEVIRLRNVGDLQALIDKKLG